MEQQTPSPIPQLFFERLHNYSGIDFIGNDFAIFKDLPANPTVNAPIRLGPYVFAITLAGTCAVTVNSRKHTFKAGDIAALFPAQIIENLCPSKDFSALFITISADFVRECLPSQETVLPLMLHVLHSPVISVSKEETRRLQEYHALLWSRIRLNDHPYRRSIVRNISTAIFHDIAGMFRLRGPRSDKNLNRSEEIFSDFLKLVTQHCQRERNVAFYAKSLCLTAKYLSSTVKLVSGRTALDWITEYTISEAKTLLTSTNKSIQDIALLLNFPNQSFFGKYFKHNTGIAPGQFRTRIWHGQNA